MSSKATFTSKLGVIAATVGSAVGLGTIWRFPNEVQANGGSIFLVAYLISVVLMGIPVMLAGFQWPKPMPEGMEELANYQAITASGTSVAHVSGYASGLYLLSIPLIVGSAETPDSTAFGEDSVNVTAVTKMVTKKSKDLKANRTVDLVSMTGSTNIPIPIPFLFYWKTATVSGNAVK